MNFKDVYKSANNRIHANHTSVEYIFEKAENETSSFSKFYSAFALVAVAAVLIVFVSNTNITNIENASEKTDMLTRTTGTPYREEKIENSHGESSDNPKAGNENVNFDLYARKDDTKVSGEKIKFISEDAYYNYLGVDFNKLFATNDKIAFDMPDEYRIMYDENSVVIDDTAEIYAEYKQSGKTDFVIRLSRIFSPDSNSVGDTLMIGDTNVFMAKSSSFESAFFKYNDIWIQVDAPEKSTDELTSFLNDLIGKKS